MIFWLTLVRTSFGFGHWKTPFIIDLFWRSVPVFGSKMLPVLCENILFFLSLFQIGVVGSSIVRFSTNSRFFYTFSLILTPIHLYRGVLNLRRLCIHENWGPIYLYGVSFHLSPDLSLESEFCTSGSDLVSDLPLQKDFQCFIPDFSLESEFWTSGSAFSLDLSLESGFEPSAVLLS